MPFFSISTPPLLNLLFPSVDAHLHSDETLQVSLRLPRLILHMRCSTRYNRLDNFDMDLQPVKF
jgi:hypothetical protein